VLYFERSSTISGGYLAFQMIIKGLTIGFSIAAIVGPIGVLCIRRTLTEGRVPGLVTGLGAATADAFYGAVAGFGLTLISNFLVNQLFWLRILGGLYLLYLGLKTIIEKPKHEEHEMVRIKLFGAYSSTFLLTLTNPMTILSFVAVFLGLGLTPDAGNYLSATILVLGVFLGSTLWWILLSGGVSLLRDKFDFAMLRWVNRISGGIISGFGFYSLISAITG
jgi:threonine/homoserine/homoserine lactone efflux protein